MSFTRVPFLLLPVNIHVQLVIRVHVFSNKDRVIIKAVAIRWRTIPNDNSTSHLVLLNIVHDCIVNDKIIDPTELDHKK